MVVAHLLSPVPGLAVCLRSSCFPPLACCCCFPPAAVPLTVADMLCAEENMCTVMELCMAGHSSETERSSVLDKKKRHGLLHTTSLGACRRMLARFSSIDTATTAVKV